MSRWQPRRQFGAHEVVQITNVEDPVKGKEATTDHRGPDVVIEAVGRPQAGNGRLTWSARAAR